MKPDGDSLLLLRRLHRRIFGCGEVRTVLEEAFAELTSVLLERPDPPHATSVIPVELFRDGPNPATEDSVRLCRLFLLRRSARMGTPERHRNSVQRLVSWCGSGRIRPAVPGERPFGLRPREIRSPLGSRSSAGGWRDEEELSACWDIVPAGVWHYPEATADHDWATVTFHSAGEREIVDELWEGP